VKNEEVAKHVGKVVEFIDSIEGLDATQKVAVLKTSVSLIENAIQAEAIKQALYNAFKGG